MAGTYIDGPNPLPISQLSMEVARGRYDNMVSVNKFGRNIEIDSGVTADIWDGGHTVASGGVSLIWVAPTAARTHQITSDSTNDTSAGTGARTIRIYGLTDWDTKEVSEDITMNGTSNVATTNDYVIIYRMKVLTKGASGPNVGTITATANTDSTITAQIRAGQGQTQMAIFGIPSVQDAYIFQYYFAANKSGGVAGGCDVALMVNPEPDTELTGFLHKHTLGVNTTGSSHANHTFNPPFKVEGPAIIKVHGDSGVNDIDVSAGFDLVCVDR